jgi:TIR domain
MPIFKTRVSDAGLRHMTCRLAPRRGMRLMRRLRDRLLLILSGNSIASDWVEDEVNKAFAEERERRQLVLFPVRIDDAVMATSEAWARKLRDQRNIGDFQKWKEHDAYQKALERLLRE